jgi:hypothetical protein
MGIAKHGTVAAPAAGPQAGCLAWSGSSTVRAQLEETTAALGALEARQVVRVGRRKGNCKANHQCTPMDDVDHGQLPSRRAAGAADLHVTLDKG